MMRVRNKFIAGFAGAALAASGLAGAQTAEAASVNEMLLDVATQANKVGESISYRFQDRDWGVLMDPTATNVKNGASTFDQFDIVRGSFRMELVDTTEGLGGSATFGLGDNNYLFGRYSLQIVNDPSASGEVHFGVDPNTPFGVAGRAFEFYESSNPHGLSSTSNTQANEAGFTTVTGVAGAQLWAAAGFYDLSDEWNYLVSVNAPSDEVEDWYEAGENDPLANGFPDQQVLSWDPTAGPNLGADGHLIEAFASQWINGAITTFNVVGTGGSDEVFGSTGSIGTQMTLIPTPTAALAGLVGIGFVGFVRRRRATQEA